MEGEYMVEIRPFGARGAWMCRNTANDISFQAAIPRDTYFHTSDAHDGARFLPSNRRSMTSPARAEEAWRGKLSGWYISSSVRPEKGAMLSIEWAANPSP